MAIKLRDGAWRVAAISMAVCGGLLPLQTRRRRRRRLPGRSAEGACDGGREGGVGCLPAAHRSRCHRRIPLAAYRAALCYLQADTPDVVAAKAWLVRSSEAGFMPAHRLLRNLLIAEAGMHGSAAHCHTLGEGQQLCHGGSAPPSLATAATQ